MSILYVFPGQGSQVIGMGKLFAESFKVSKDVFDEVDEALSEKLSKLIWEGSQDELTMTKNAQPALMTVSIAILRAIEFERGLDLSKIKYVAGHSLGEYSALAATEVFEDSGAWVLPVVDAEGIFLGTVSKSMLFDRYRSELIVQTADHLE
mgnify:CR=1 FL=1